MANRMRDTSAEDGREYLRQVAIEWRRDGSGFVLRTWEALDDQGRPRRYETGQWIIGYQFEGRDGAILFTGEDCGVAPSDAIDSDGALRGLLGFLTLKPGDTDSEYFENYTPEQMEFARTDAEFLSLYADEEDPPAFKNLDGWEA